MGDQLLPLTGKLIGIEIGVGGHGQNFAGGGVEQYQSAFMTGQQLVSTLL